VEVAGIDGDRASELGDAAVAGRAEDLRDLRRFVERPYEGVLAAATTDDKNLHVLMHSSYLSDSQPII
jgi:hypothetical protein